MSLNSLIPIEIITHQAATKAQLVQLGFVLSPMLRAVVSHVKHTFAELTESEQLHIKCFTTLNSGYEIDLLIISGEPGIGSAPTQSTPSQSVITVSKELIQADTSESEREATSLHTGLVMVGEGVTLN